MTTQEYDHIAEYVDKIRSEVSDTLELLYSMTPYAKDEALDSIIKVYYIQRITHEFIDWMGGLPSYTNTITGEEFNGGPE